MAQQPQFDRGKLELHRLELKFLTSAADLLPEARAGELPHLRDVRGPLDRASLSAALNPAEGNGRRASRQRARFFDDARGTATERAACPDAMVAKRAGREERIVGGKALLARSVSSLGKLVGRFDSAGSESSGGGISRTGTT